LVRLFVDDRLPEDWCLCRWVIGQAEVWELRLLSLDSGDVMLLSWRVRLLRGVLEVVQVIVNFQNFNGGGKDLTVRKVCK